MAAGGTMPQPAQLVPAARTTKAAALEAHSQLLRARGALDPRLTLYGSFALDQTWQAVVIDNLVNLCVMPVNEDPLGASPAKLLHASAQEAYLSEGVEGSPEKDVKGQNLFKALGAEVDSRPASVGRGLVWAPLCRDGSFLLP